MELGLFFVLLCFFICVAVILSLNIEKCEELDEEERDYLVRWNEYGDR